MRQLLTRMRLPLPLAGWLPLLASRLACIVAGLVLIHAASAAPNPVLQHYNHSVWTSKDGAPGPVRAMAQTTDGWLWLGTPTGLYRFDGLRFHPFAASDGGRLLSRRISWLEADSAGDLYIAYEDAGLSVLHADGRLEHLAPADRNSPVGNAHAMLRDIDGTLWVSTSTGLMHLEGGRWSRVGTAQGFPEEVTALVTLDADKQLWAASLNRLFRYDRAQRRFAPVDLQTPGSGGRPPYFLGMVMSPDGRIWNADNCRFVVMPLAPSLRGRPTHANARVANYNGLFDREGHAWAVRCPAGVSLAAGAGAGAGASAHIDMSSATGSRLDQAWQVGSLAPNLILEDLEGNIWLGANNSLERFRKNALTPIELPQVTGVFHVAPDSDGLVWIVAPTNRQAWKYEPASRRLTGLPGTYRGAARSADGTVVMLREDGIRRRRAGVEDLIALPDLPPGAWVRTDGDLVWLGGAGKPVQVWNGRVWTALPHPKPSEFTFSAAGRQGQMWRGLVDGHLLMFEQGRITKTFDQAALGGIGTASCLSALPELVVCGDEGVAAWDGRRFRRLQAAQPDWLRNVSGVVATADGTRWLNGKAGLLRVEEADWRRSVDSGVPLRATLLDALDGYTATAADAPSLTIVGNRLWVSTAAGILELDPAARVRNPIAPQVALLALNGDGISYPLTRPTIREGTRRVSIDFTAPALRKPERIVFSYRLDGVDETWQTGPDRSATYTELAPGPYVFRVRAMNEDGVWSAHERTLAFDVAPTLMQTTWFKLACALASLLLLWLTFRLRLRYLTRRLHRRHQVQLEERSRIARELHDSLLQNFQGAVLEMRAALSGLDAASPVRERLQAGMREANAAIAEGRDKVTALRDARAGQTGLPDFLRELGEREAGPGRHFSLRIAGVERPLQPVVEQELCAIGREALCNAFRHAEARAHEALIEYGSRSLVLTIRDDGRGIAPGDRDKPGHWGLHGIEERARLIHAKAELHTAPGEGTLWRIEIRGRLAYATSGWRRRLRWMRP